MSKTEWRGENYSRQASLQEAIALETLATIPFAGNERVLDIGCGDGKITSQIASRVPEGSVVGTDISSDMITFASDHFGGTDRKKPRFLVADACRLPFEREFDLVVSFNALHWVRDQASALSSIAAVLRPGGKAILQFVPEGLHKSIEDVLENVRKSLRWAGFFEAFEPPFIHLTADEYRVLVEQNGLQLVEQRVTEHRWDFGSRDRFSDWCHATMVFWLGRLPEDQRQLFINEVLDQYQLAAPPGFRNESTFTFYQMKVLLGLAG